MAHKALLARRARMVRGDAGEEGMDHHREATRVREGDTVARLEVAMDREAVSEEAHPLLDGTAEAEEGMGRRPLAWQWVCAVHRDRLLQATPMIHTLGDHHNQGLEMLLLLRWILLRIRIWQDLMCR